MGIAASTGLISGLQTDSIISAMVTAEKAPITQLQKKQAAYQSKISSYGTLKSALSSLQSALSDLKSTSSYSTGFSSTSSNKDILGVNVTDSSKAAAGSYKLIVKRTATSAQMTSNTNTSSTSSIGAGVLQFRIGDGNKQSITIDSSNNSLSDIAKTINDAKAGVSASVLQVADNDYRLVVTANDTGKDISYSYQESGLTFSTSTQANSSTGETMKSQGFDSNSTALGLTGTLSINGSDITLTGTETLNDIQASIDALNNVTASVSLDSETGKYVLSVSNDQAEGSVNINFGDGNAATGLSGLMNDSATLAAQTALININNIDVERKSNTIDDLINGLTLRLNGQDETETININVTANYDTAKTKMTAFVSAYNSVVTSLDSLQSYDSSTQKAGNLLGDSTANMLRSGLRRMLFTSLDGFSSDVNSLSKLGISVEDTGQLSFDSTKFSTAMSNNADGVTEFLTKSTGATKGLAVQFESFVSAYTDSKEGILQAKIDGYTKSSDKIDDNIEAINLRVSKYETNLRKQFDNLETILSSLTSTQTYLTGQLSSLSNMTSKFYS